eukprot:g6880.t1
MKGTEGEQDESLVEDKVQSKDNPIGLGALLGDGKDDLEFDFDSRNPNRKKPKFELESMDLSVDKLVPAEAVKEPEETPMVVDMESCTCALHITNFVRPFTKKAVIEMLAEYGTIEEMWMPTIKTHCYVLFKNAEYAQNAYLGTYNLIWPRNGKRLIPRFVPEAEAKKAIVEGRSHVGNSCRGPSVGEKLTPVQMTAAKPRVSLEDLFFKTAVKPPIYYLPLTDEEVQEKKRNKNR